MRLISFTRPAGAGPIYVNPRHVVSVEHNDGGGVLVNVTGGRYFVVDGPFAEVHGRLTGTVR